MEPIAEHEGDCDAGLNVALLAVEPQHLLHHLRMNFSTKSVMVDAFPKVTVAVCRILVQVPTGSKFQEG